jgi:hypothetical protein
VKALSPSVLEALQVLTPFIPKLQMRALREFLDGEEGAYFAGLLMGWADKVANCPQTYAQDGLGLQTVAHLHYFGGGFDWHITEIDADLDGEGQVQAFGQADLGWGPELGYISIEELVKARGIELDLHWVPTTLAVIRARKN